MRPPEKIIPAKHVFVELSFQTRLRPGRDRVGGSSLHPLLQLNFDSPKWQGDQSSQTEEGVLALLIALDSLVRSLTRDTTFHINSNGWALGGNLLVVVS